MIQALKSLRGIATITATSLVAEIGSFKRFASPKKLMLLVEAAWSYRFPPAIKGDLKKRLEGQLPNVQMISWKAQNRLHKKYFRLLSRGKAFGKALTAIARELAGFIWAVTQEIENSSMAK